MDVPAGRYARYPESTLADSFGMSSVTANTSWAKATTARRPQGGRDAHKDPRTGERAGRNKWHSGLHHGPDFSSAWANRLKRWRRTRQVKDKFPDAREAIDFFVHRASRCRRSPRSGPNKCRTFVLKYCGSDLKVYRVDLLKFGLLQRNLAKITGINLAGRPPAAFTRSATARITATARRIVALPLKEEGAYLLSVAGGMITPAAGVGLAAGFDRAGGRGERASPCNGQRRRRRPLCQQSGWSRSSEARIRTSSRVRRTCAASSRPTPSAERPQSSLGENRDVTPSSAERNPSGPLQSKARLRNRLPARRKTEASPNRGRIHQNHCWKTWSEARAACNNSSGIATAICCVIENKGVKAQDAF